MAYLPITDHGLIGDLHTAALVGRDGRVVWLPWPRFDSASLFAAILDDQRGGDWLIAPEGASSTRQSYDGETAILLTSFETPGGRAELRDWMTPWEGETTVHDIYRVLRCTEGEVEVTGRFAPLPDYARSRATLTTEEDGFSFTAHGDRCYFASNHRWMPDQGGAAIRVTLRAGEELRCVLGYGTRMSADDTSDAIETTRRFWEDWIGRCSLEGRWRDAVRRSAITLKLLTYAPSGAIVAAPTTSLPEWIGGVRNWDYRYTWLRDASFTLYAFYRLGYDEEARSFFGWLDERARQYGTPLQIMYGVDGEANLAETELPHLEGYRGSRPVRIGNGAYDQRQLDVYGGVVDAAYLYEQQGDLLSQQQWEALRNEIDYVRAHWTEPDHGIWEIRGPLQHHTFSKLMCWLTLDRGIRIAEHEGWEYDRERWEKTREDIRENILAHGWNDEIQAFTMTYDAKELDASVLVMPLVGFLPADDERIQSTIARIDEQLGEGALVYRYRMDDHLPGEEGAFLLCSFWMVDVLAKCGRVEEAVQRFEELLSYTSEHGLLSEEVDHRSGTALGNYPQAFSHIGLVNSASNLNRALGDSSAS